MSIENSSERAMRHALEAASHELAKMARRMDRLYDLPADGKRLRKIVATLDSLASGLVADEGRALGTTPSVLPEPKKAVCERQPKLPFPEPAPFRPARCESYGAGCICPGCLGKDSANGWSP